MITRNEIYMIIRESYVHDLGLIDERDQDAAIKTWAGGAADAIYRQIASVPVPVDPRHAQMMYLVGKQYLEDVADSTKRRLGVSNDPE